jgi:hypothetical protein
MRRFAFLLVLMAAAPAAAQDAAGLAALQMRETELSSQQDLSRARAVALENQLSTLEAQVQTNQRLQDLQAHNLRLRLPAPVVPVRPLDPASLDPGRYPSIPDDALAASRARIAAASRNRR